ncbi:hypothetical protein ASPWEDRAFT_120960 [Aspergillus wentii DTO 134E9]|uniref:Proline utilization protein PrnX n=1 Tax=Aspergillus wentii DTO 134E9 TaxID=1073089 RepID=A0A1L9R602_ASPWE|nr:uncharacterized protein ASPWEDRAFT_120960 [Aspergillus wentii DTO 134E9]KAI9925176.1 hypothetical protein MW887_006096 [Aspergillus wentii]OJJ30334.1 hypothetical protein ASPWEDRAFT_120960 [Aspergillus wentii DTO 134E9]
MRLVPEQAVSQILRQMTQEQCYGFIDTMNQSLVGVLSESNTPESEKLIHQPLRTTFSQGENLSLFMPVSSRDNKGIKIVTASSSGINGVINIFSPEGNLEGLLNAAEITAFRTALAIMTLFVRCSTLKKENIVILGSGRQAEWHARLALLLVPDQIRRITFINRGRKRLEELENETIASLRISHPNVEMTTFAQENTPDYDARLRSELGSSDVIFSCTPATQPNFPHAYLQQSQKQRFISLIGSYKPHMKEVDTETILSGGGKIYVDSKEACLEESGELIQAQIQEDQLVELGELYKTHDKSEPVQVPEGCNVVFKCVGMGIMDLAIGTRVMDLARERGLGMEVDGF